METAERIGKYELLDRIGVGGMAEVFRARASGPLGFRKTLCLKLVNPRVAQDERFAQLFLGEARLAARLNHPNVVQIFDFGQEGERWFIAMELVEGPNLRQVLAATRGKEPMPLPLACRIVSSACDGLAYAHELKDEATGSALGIIHRDVSPENIMVSRTGAVKVVDFGIAKGAVGSAFTQAGAVLGKLGYLTPEQVKKEPLDRRVDVFGLGIVFYELLTNGHMPMSASSEGEFVGAILERPFIAASVRRPDLPSELSRILERALAKDRGERYPDCRAFQRDVDAWLKRTREAPGPSEVGDYVSRVLPPRAPAYAREASANPTELVIDAVATTEPNRRGPTEPMRGQTTEPSVGGAQKKTRWAWGVAPTAALLVAAAFAWRSLHRVSSAPESRAPVEALAAAPTAVEAPAVAPAPVEPIPQAPVVAPPAPEAKAPTPARHVRKPQLGEVEFRIFPYATVFLDGRKLGDTPLSPLEVPEGKHAIRLVNAPEHKSVSVDYTVKAGQKNVFRYELR